jgi:hypothetical protein
MKSKDYYQLSYYFGIGALLCLCVLIVGCAYYSYLEEVSKVIKYFVLGIVSYLVFAVPAKLFTKIGDKKLLEEAKKDLRQELESKFMKRLREAQEKSKAKKYEK